MPRHRCCFCGWTRNNRTYRNVGTSEYPEDEVCNLCDTEAPDGESGTEKQGSKASRASSGHKSE